MEEIKGKLLDKIDSLLENADAEDVRKLSEAYADLNRDSLMAQIAKNNSFGVCNCEAGTTKEEKKGE